MSERIRIKGLDCVQRGNNLDFESAPSEELVRELVSQGYVVAFPNGETFPVGTPKQWEEKAWTKGNVQSHVKSILGCFFLALFTLVFFGGIGVGIFLLLSPHIP